MSNIEASSRVADRQSLVRLGQALHNLILRSFSSRGIKVTTLSDGYKYFGSRHEGSYYFLGLHNDQVFGTHFMAPCQRINLTKLLTDPAELKRFGAPQLRALTQRVRIALDPKNLLETFHGEL